MAVELQDHGELLLNPSQFLAEEHSVLSVNKPINHNGFGSSWSGRDFSSPVESEVGSTETECSDEDDVYIAELTRQMAHYMLQDDDQHALQSIGSEEQRKSWGLIGSRQSTLWSPLDSNYGTPRGPSKEQSPPRMPSCGKSDSWDVPHDVVGKLEKMKLNNEWPKYQQNQRLVGKPHKPTSAPVAVKKPNVGFHSNEALSDDQICAIQLYRLKQEQPIKHQGSAYWGTQAKIPQDFEPKQQHRNLHNKSRASGFGSVGMARPQNLSSNPWPTLPQQKNHQHPAGSGMRAVFLDGSGSKTGSCGTGVFLPRGINNPSESRKKPGCSTVLIPARVVQALKLHFEQTGAPSQSGAGAFPMQHADALLGSGDGLISHQKRHFHRAPAMKQYEMGLPQEWTY